MIYKQLINHKLFKFIQIGNRTALVVRSADAVELGAFGRVQGALAHGTVVDVGTFAYFCKYNISFRIYRNVDYDSSLFLDRVSWAWETSRSDRTSVQVERTISANTFISPVVGISERATLIAGSGSGISLAVPFLAAYSESTCDLVADGLFFLAAFFGKAFLLGFLLADAFFFSLLFPFFLFFFLALLFFFFFLLCLFDCDAFFDLLRHQIFLRSFYLRFRNGRGRSRRFLWRFLSGIFRFESPGCRIDISEVHQYTAVFIGNDGFENRESQNQQDEQVECHRTHYAIYVIFI